MALAQSLPWIERWIPGSELRLGGGTALAAFWNHRHSADVDLACDRRLFAERVYARRDEVRSHLRRIASQGSIRRRWRLNRSMVGWYTRHGPVSLVASRLTPRPGLRLRSGFAEARTGVAVNSVEAVLTGKIGGRALFKREIPARDAYDVACSRLLDADSLTRALEGLEPEELADYWAINDGLVDDPPPDSPILRPRFPEVAANPWLASRLLVREGRTLADLRDPNPEGSQGGRADGRPEAV